MDLDRRTLLAQIALLMSGVAACRRKEASRQAAPDAAPASQPASTPAAAPERALLPLQREALAAAFARIIPTDHEPGATEAEVIEYVDRELARPEHVELKQKVIAGITALNRHAARGAKLTFVQLEPAEQDQVLHQIQRGSERGAELLLLLTALALEGFLGDPRWGANAGGVGWTFAGYGPGRMVGHEH